jgi:hypothetical protein
MSSENLTENPPPPPGRSYRDALERVRPVLMAIPRDHLIREPKLDPSRTARMAEATATKLLPLRAALVAECGERAGVVLDGLVTIADAVKQADIEVERTKTSDDLSHLHAAVMKHHQALLTDAHALVSRNVIPLSEVERAETTKGYKPLLKSLLILVSLFRELADDPVAQVLVKPTDLDAAELAVQRMNTAIAYRDQGVSQLAALDLRTRAMTKLIRDYDAIRRFVTYVRWEEGDADDLAPSFWAASRGTARRSRKRRGPLEPTPAPASVRSDRDARPR